jgi:hypothetical protein
VGSLIGLVVGYFKSSAIFGGFLAWLLGPGPAAKIFVVVISFAAMGLAFGVYGLTVGASAYKQGTDVMKQAAQSAPQNPAAPAPKAPAKAQPTPIR